MIAYPYTKLLTANMQVDQGAALIMCSAAAADVGRRPPRPVGLPAGRCRRRRPLVPLPPGRTSTPHRPSGWPASRPCRWPGRPSTTSPTSTSTPASPRPWRSPPTSSGCPTTTRPAPHGHRWSHLRGWSGQQLRHPRGGLDGRALRADPGSLGLVTGLGWYLTKHSFGIYGTEPPGPTGLAPGPRPGPPEPPTPPVCPRERRPGGGRVRLGLPAAAVAALPQCSPDADAEGEVTVETYSVVLRAGRRRPVRAVVACRTPDGRRAWANVTDPDQLAVLVTEEGCGRLGTLRPDARSTSPDRGEPTAPSDLQRLPAQPHSDGVGPTVEGKDSPPVTGPTPFFQGRT